MHPLYKPKTDWIRMIADSKGFFLFLSLSANSEQKRKWNRETVRASENINFKLKEDEAIPKSQKLNGIRKGRLSTTHESAVHLHLILIQAESHRNNLSVIYSMVRKKERKTLWHLKVISKMMVQLNHCFIVLRLWIIFKGGEVYKTLQHCTSVTLR